MRRLGCFVLAVVVIAPGVDAQIQLDDEAKLTLYGDLRFRFESDWDSRDPNGRIRDDRDRLRIRGRVGLSWKPIDFATAEFRVRTGQRTSQQSPHLTIYDFDGSDTGPKQATFDRLFLRLERESAEVWLGRNSNPFWKQNELVWDDDASLNGVMARYEWQRSDSELSVIGGVYLLPDGMEAVAGRLAAGQFVYVVQRPQMRVTLASGLFWISGTDDTEHLRNGNGGRDYKLWTSNAQARFDRWTKPVTLGLDASYNFHDYSSSGTSSFTAANQNQRAGFVASFIIGNALQPGDWLASYYYAYVETFAVNASFAQDDWMRWGSGGQTDASDFKGHEFRFAMGLVPNLHAVARLFLVDAITTAQNGKRFRFDLNYRF